jgi:hypothetical protein
MFQHVAKKGNDFSKITFIFGLEPNYFIGDCWFFTPHD